MSGCKEKALKEFVDMVTSNISIIRDPMNGCPGDFAEDFARDEQREILKLYCLGVTDEEIAEAYAKASREANEQYERIFGGKR